MIKYLAYFKELFYALSGCLVIFGLMELIKPGIILAYINYSWLLIFWLISGMVILILSQEK
jgi:hypothetical protein